MSVPYGLATCVFGLQADSEHAKPDEEVAKDHCENDNAKDEGRMESRGWNDVSRSECQV